MSASITIASPTSGSTVPRLIGVSGTYTTDQSAPSITAVLKDSGGNIVASANAVLTNGTWTASLFAQQAYTDASIEATLNGTGASDSVGNLTVQ
jgi:hypothetical protein